MAARNQTDFKLLNTVDPTTIVVPIREKFAKLTLSSNKKKQQTAQTLQTDAEPAGKRASRNLLVELNEQIADTAEQESPTDTSYEHPLLRSDSSSDNMGLQCTTAAEQQETQLDFNKSEYMEALYISGDGLSQQANELEIERLSQRVSNLTMQTEGKQMQQHEQLLNEVSINISSTTEEEFGELENSSTSCITISDSTLSEKIDNSTANNQQVAEQSMAVSEQPIMTTAPLAEDKMARIEAFLKDVSFERHEMKRRAELGLASPTLSPLSADTMKNMANADTESMSAASGVDDCETPTLHRTLDEQLQHNSKRLACNETEINTTCASTFIDQLNNSRRLADMETEANTMCSNSLEEQHNNSRRLASDDTEVNTLLSNELGDESAVNATLNETVSQSDVELDESLTIPETCSESEQTPKKCESSRSAASTSDEDVAVQVNISTKINIRIQIPTMDTSSAESESQSDGNDADAPRRSTQSDVEVQCQKQQPEQQVDEAECSKLCDSNDSDSAEDGEFLSHAEKLLNQLYGKAWQTPDVIRTLKRSSSSGDKTVRTPLTALNQQSKVPQTATTTGKKRTQRTKKDESALGDFNLFKHAVHANKLNSTRLTKAPQTERRPAKPRILTNHKDEARWRQLIDSDSGSDASDDSEADATESSSEEDDAVGAAHITYLDLTKDVVEVVESPEKQSKSPDQQERLQDILRTCRAGTKPKLPATPEQPIVTRRQLFTPNVGYEDEGTAKHIVDQALDLDMLDDLDNVYLPGTNVHKRLQEVRKQLDILPVTPKGKPIFKPLPQTAPNAKLLERRAIAKKINEHSNTPFGITKKCNFLKSLDAQISRAQCDNEAYFYRENYAKNKEELAKKLYDMFNEKLFDNKLNVQVRWSKLLRNTAGVCRNKKRLNERSSVVDLSEKVLTSADRLRCTLIHELCHAASWIFDGENGHGRVWKSWARRANNMFPGLPPIKVCHDYQIEFKYTYKCVNCDKSSHSHSKCKKREHVRCSTCNGPITLFRNKKDKAGNIVSTQVGEPVGFAKFVKDNYHKYKQDKLPNKEIMRLLGAEYAKQKQQTPDAIDKLESQFKQVKA